MKQIIQLGLLPDQETVKTIDSSNYQQLLIPRLISAKTPNIKTHDNKTKAQTLLKVMQDQDDSDKITFNDNLCCQYLEPSCYARFTFETKKLALAYKSLVTTIGWLTREITHKDLLYQFTAYSCSRNAIKMLTILARYDFTRLPDKQDIAYTELMLLVDDDDDDDDN